MRDRARIFVATISILSFSGCSNVPSLDTAPEQGPTVSQIVNHINCEINSIVQENPSSDADLPRFVGRGPLDGRIQQRVIGNTRLKDLIAHLREDHFVASVLLTIDTTNSEDIYPRLVSFIPSPAV